MLLVEDAGAVEVVAVEAGLLTVADDVEVVAAGLETAGVAVVVERTGAVESAGAAGLLVVAAGAAVVLGAVTIGAAVCTAGAGAAFGAGAAAVGGGEAVCLDAAKDGQLASAISTIASAAVRFLAGKPGIGSSRRACLAEQPRIECGRTCMQGSFPAGLMP